MKQAYVINFDNINTIEDIKNILKCLDIKFTTSGKYIKTKFDI